MATSRDVQWRCATMLYFVTPSACRVKLWTGFGPMFWHGQTHGNSSWQRLWSTFLCEAPNWKIFSWVKKSFSFFSVGIKPKAEDQRLNFIEYYMIIPLPQETESFRRNHGMRFASFPEHTVKDVNAAKEVRDCAWPTSLWLCDNSLSCDRHHHSVLNIDMAGYLWHLKNTQKNSLYTQSWARFLFRISPV